MRTRNKILLNKREYNSNTITINYKVSNLEQVKFIKQAAETGQSNIYGITNKKPDIKLFYEFNQKTRQIEVAKIHSLISIIEDFCHTCLEPMVYPIGFYLTVRSIKDLSFIDNFKTQTVLYADDYKLRHNLPNQLWDIIFNPEQSSLPWKLNRNTNLYLDKITLSIENVKCYEEAKNYRNHLNITKAKLLKIQGQKSLLPIHLSYSLSIYK